MPIFTPKTDVAIVPGESNTSVTVNVETSTKVSVDVDVNNPRFAELLGALIELAK